MTDTSAGPIRLFVLGDARIETPVGVIEPTAELVFATALYLILERKEPVSRRKLERVLWPGAEKTVASHRLRQTLLKLSKTGLPIERFGNSRIGLVDHILLDSVEIMAQGAASFSLGTCPSFALFAGYNPTFSSAYAEWLDAKRDEISAALTRFLLEAIAQKRDVGSWEDVEAFATALREFAPLNEEASLALAESYAMRGAKIESIRILDEYISEVGYASDDLRVQATLLRRRVANATPLTERNGSRDNTLFGRSDALRSLTHQLSLAKNGNGQSCLILGEAGIGKSRLLAELSSFAGLQGFTTQRIQCRASHKHRPLSVFVELVPLLRTMRGAIGCSPDTLADLDRLTLHRPLDRTGSIDSSDPQWAYGRVLRALFDIVDAVADESPLLIEIEDAHWLDATSGEVLADMMQWATDRRVYFALTAREVPDVWSGSLPEVIKELVLLPLDDTSASELLISIAHRFNRVIDETYVRWCTTVAEGNPYFLQELAAYWGETGEHQKVPPSLSSVLGRRVDQLDSDALQVLQACALLENNASLQRVEAALQYEPYRLLSAINSLGSVGMIVFEPEESDGGGQRRISSKHDLLSNVALDRLSTPGRAYLHRRIGTVLEQEVNEHYPTAILWDCAKHWRLAGDSQRALSLALSCASHLMEVGLSKEALDVYERCIPFCRSDLQRLEVLEREAVALYRGSDWQRLRHTATLARAVKSRVYPDASGHDDLELMDLRAQWQSLQWDEIASKAIQCLERTDAHPRHRVEGGIMAMMLLGFSHDAESTIETSHLTISNLIKRHGLGAALHHQAEMVYHTGFGVLQDGVAAARQLIAAHQAQGEIAELFRSYCNSSVTLRVAGLFDEAEKNLRSGLELAEKYGLDLSMIRVLPMLANMELERGNIEAARNWHSRLSSLTIDSANRFGQLEAGGIGARLALLDGDGGEALRRWPLSRAEAHADSIPHRRAYNCALQIGIDLATAGKPHWETLTILVEAYQRSKRGFHQAFNISIIYAAFERIGERNKSDEIFQDYVANHRREPWPVPRHLIDSALGLGR